MNSFVTSKNVKWPRLIWPTLYTSSTATATLSFWIRNWSHITTHLVVVVVFVGAMLYKKSLRLRHFKSDLGEIWQDCSSSKFASIDSVTFLIWCHTFKMAAMTSFHKNLRLRHFKLN